jgi:hypothetical protein
MSVTRDGLQYLGGLQDRNPAFPITSDFGLVGWSEDPQTLTTASTPTAGVLQLARVPIRIPSVVSNILYLVTQAGIGAQLPVNVFVGLYDQYGNRLGAGSAAQDTVVQTGGMKTAALVGLGGLFILPPWVWIAFLIGTQSTTPVQLLSPTGFVGAWGTVGPTTRHGTVGAGLTALPATLIPANIITTTTLMAAVS